MSGHLRSSVLSDAADPLTFAAGYVRGAQRDDASLDHRRVCAQMARVALAAAEERMARLRVALADAVRELEGEP